MATNNITMAAAIQQRAHLLDQINDHVKQLNKDFQENPAALDTETIKQLMGNLRQINKTIQEKVEANEKRSCCCCPWVKATTYAAIGINIVSWLAIGGVSIWQVATAEDEDDTKRSAGMVALSVMGLFLGSVLGPGVKMIDDDADKYKLFSSVSEIKEQNEAHFQEFLDMFDEFKKNVAHKKSDPKDALSECIQLLDSMPQDGYKEKIPSRDHWISLMIHMLPEKHPLKLKLRELQAAAMEIFEFEESGGKVNPDSHESSPESSPHLKRKNKLKLEKPDKLLASSDSDHSPRTSFKGESLSAPPWMRLNLRPKAHRSDSEESMGMHGSKKLPLGSVPIQVQSEEFRRMYHNEWRRIEEEMGFRLDRLQLDGCVIDRECRLASRLEHLQPHPALHLKENAGEVSIVIGEI